MGLYASEPPEKQLLSPATLAILGIILPFVGTIISAVISLLDKLGNLLIGADEGAEPKQTFADDCSINGGLWRMVRLPKMLPSRWTPRPSEIC